MSLKAHTVQNGKIAIFDLKGSLIGDEETDALRSTVVDFLEQGNKYLVINLHKVNYLNSSGIGAIISAHASYTKNGGTVRLACLTNNIQNLLAVTRLIDIFEVYETVESAIESFATVKTHS